MTAMAFKEGSSLSKEAVSQRKAIIASQKKSPVADAATKVKSAPKPSDPKPRAPRASSAPTARKTGGQGGSALKMFGKYSAKGGSTGSVSTYRNILAAELVLGSVCILTNRTAQDEDSSFAKTLAQLGYFYGAFFFLSLISVGGPKAAKVSASFGGLVVIGLLLKNSTILLRFNPANNATLNGSATPVSHALPGLSDPNIGQKGNVAANLLTPGLLDQILNIVKTPTQHIGGTF